MFRINRVLRYSPLRQLARLFKITFYVFSPLQDMGFAIFSCTEFSSFHQNSMSHERPLQFGLWQIHWDLRAFSLYLMSFIQFYKKVCMDFILFTDEWALQSKWFCLKGCCFLWLYEDMWQQKVQEMVNFIWLHLMTTQTHLQVVFVWVFNFS